MSVQEKVIAFLAEKFGEKPCKITRETNFVADLGEDSLGIVNLLGEVEEKFGVKFSDEDLESFGTVGEVIDRIIGS